MDLPPGKTYMWFTYDGLAHNTLQFFNKYQDNWQLRSVTSEYLANHIIIIPNTNDTTLFRFAFFGISPCILTVFMHIDVLLFCRHFLQLMKIWVPNYRELHALGDLTSEPCLARKVTVQPYLLFKLEVVGSWLNVSSILFSLLPFEYFIINTPTDLKTVLVGVHYSFRLPED